MVSYELSVSDNELKLSRTERPLSMAATTSLLHVSESSNTSAAQLPSSVKLGLGARLSEGF
jgi:hypothetical protein